MIWQQWTALYQQITDRWIQQVGQDFSPENSRDIADKFICMQALSEQVLAIFRTGKGCTYLSHSWERITGQPAKECMGSDFYAVIHEPHVKPFVIALQQAVAGDAEQGSLYPHQFQIKHADGMLRWFELNIAAVRPMENSREQEIICSLKDVQDMVSMRAAMQHAKREMEMAMKARSELLANVSHDLRTPLNAILGFTQIMEEGLFGEIKNPQYADYLVHIRESGYELLSYVDSLLETAQEEGKLKPRIAATPKPAAAPKWKAKRPSRGARMVSSKLLAATA